MKTSPKFMLVTIGLVVVLLGSATWVLAQSSAGSFTDLTCTTGQIARFDGEAWACADDLAEMQAELDAMAMKVDPEAEFIATVYAFEDAIKANDAARVSDFYADEAVVILPGLPPLEGKEAIQADYEYFFDAYQVERESELIYANVDGDTAVRRMSWTNTLTPKDGGEPIVDTGNCILGFKKIDGAWKTVWDISATYDPTAQ